MRLTAEHAEGDTAGALTAETFSALMASFHPFERNPALAVGVSGGRDSLALALLAHDWARELGGHAVAMIVDHGLRAEAAAEASLTRDMLRRRGLDAEILPWLGAKPSRGIQAAARKARYDLLLEACRRRGLLHLLLAHQADDQAETVAMRAAHDSGPDGLAGMSAIVEYPHVRVLRPLLGVARKCLTAMLLARSVAWIDDPSNEDLRFERVRVRREMHGRSRIGPGAGARRLRSELALAIAAVETVECDVDGGIALSHTAYRAVPVELRRRLLSRLVQALSGSDHPPRRARLERAAERLARGGDRGKSGKALDFTLLGCRLMLRQAGRGQGMRWIVARESGRNDGKKRAQPLIPAGFFPCGAP